MFILPFQGIRSRVVTCFGSPPWQMQRVMHVTVEIPDQVARQSEETPDAVAGHVMEYSAVENYRYGSLSHRHVGQLLGVDYWRTKTSLGNGTCRSGNGPFIWIGSRDAGFPLFG